MKLSRWKVSPTFQLNFFASLRPMMQPRWSCMKAWYSSGGILYSGYMARKGSASTAMFGKKLLQSVVEDESSSPLPSFFAGSEPPNQEVTATRFTPGTDRMRLPYESGRLKTRLTAWRVTSRLALALSSRLLTAASTD